MGATYTRQSSSGIVDGGVIEASDLNNEFDQLLAAFVASTGHTHDGTSAEGGPITKLLGTSITIGDGTSGTDITVTFDGETGDGVLTWMEDEDYFKFSDDILVNSTEKLMFQDTGTYIYSNADGDLDIVSDGTAVDSINLESAGGITLDAGTAGSGIIYEDDGTEVLRISNSSSDVTIQTKVSDKDLYIKGNDGGSDVTALTFDMSDAGKATFGGNVVVTGDLTISGDDLTMGTNTSGMLLVADGTNFNPVAVSGDVTMASTGAITIAATSVENSMLAGSIADSKLSTISTADKVAGGAIQIDSGTDGTSITLADTDKFLVDDGGTTKYINASQINTYTSAAVALDDLSTGDAAATLATSAGDITIDAQGSDTDIIFKGTDGGADTTFLTIDGSAAGAATFNDKVIATELDISGNMDIDGTSNLDAVDIDGAVQIDNTVTVGVDDTGYDVKFFGATSGAYMLWDESTDDLILAGAAKLYLYDAGGGEYLSSSGSALTIASGGTAWELPTSDGSANQLLKTDGSGNLDWTTVSGTITALNNQSANRITTIGSTTTELDGEANLTFTGSALTCIGTITVGVDDTGHDVKFFGATAGSYALWDESADSLLLTDSTPLKIGDSQDLTLYHDGTNSYITNAQGALKIATETSGIAVTIGHTTSEVTIADNLTVTGTLSGTLDTAAQANITSLGTLTTLTVDNVITNGATIGHTSDTDLMTLADGVLTVAGEVSATTLDIGGTNIGSTAAELNLLDGSAKSTSSITLADSDAIIVIDGTTTKQIPVSDIKTYNPGGTAWQAVVTGNTTMTAGRGYFVNTTSAAITMTLPAGTIGDEISIIDYAGTFDSNNCTVAANGSEKIHASTDDLTVATERAAFTLVFTDSTQGWLLKNN